MVNRRFLVVGLVLFLIGLLWLMYRVNYIKNETVTRAVVGKILQETDSEGSQVYVPVFTYRNTQNKLMVYQGGATQDPARWYVGDTVKIVYNKSTPVTVKLITFYEVFFVPITLMALGTASIIVGVAAYFANRFLNTL